jgi:hypothetical protein
MIDAKKEIEDKLFQGAPLSLDAMMCALAAINIYIEDHGEDSNLEVNIDVDGVVKEKAVEKLHEELQKGLESGEKEGWFSMDDVKRYLGLDGDDFGD